MQARNCTMAQVEEALSKINVEYNNNVMFKRIDQENSKCIGFTLRVKNSSGAGAKIGYTGRKTVNACWHVHGDFFNALIEVNPGVVIKSLGKTIDINGGNWKDWNIGSRVDPVLYSQSCKCA